MKGFKPGPHYCATVPCERRLSDAALVSVSDFSDRRATDGLGPHGLMVQIRKEFIFSGTSAVTDLTVANHPPGNSLRLLTLSSTHYFAECMPGQIRRDLIHQCINDYYQDANGTPLVFSLRNLVEYFPNPMRAHGGNEREFCLFKVSAWLFLSFLLRSCGNLKARL